MNACASLLKAGAQCISSARWDLYGGCRVTGIPTVTINNMAKDSEWSVIIYAIIVIAPFCGYSPW